MTSAASTPTATTPTATALRFGTVRSADGTLLRTWEAGPASAPLVLLSNGLGSVPEAWPGLLGQDARHRVVSWYHRGTFGSARPSDPAAVRVEDHVDDALAVLDAAGGGPAVVAGWSIGVNVAAELAVRAPERVTGLLAVAGVPGGTFSTMGAPLGVPRPLRAPLASAVTRAARLSGGVLTRLAASTPADTRLAALLRWSGAMSTAADPERLVVLLQAFLRQDWGWYMHLAETASRHPRVALPTGLPVVFVSGSADVLTSAADVAAAAAATPGSALLALSGSHFLPLEQPERLADALDDLLAVRDDRARGA